MSKPQIQTITTPVPPVDDFRELVTTGLDADSAELMEIAGPVLARLREAWMQSFTEIMVEELKARRVR